MTKKSKQQPRRRQDDQKTVLNAVQMLGALFRHAQRYSWIAHQRGRGRAQAEIPGQVSRVHAGRSCCARRHGRRRHVAIRSRSASTGLRFRELAGLKWANADLDKGVISVRDEFTHGAWSELKTDNARRRVPLAHELKHDLTVYKLRTLGELVFPASDGAPLDYFNWRNRVWLPLLKAAGVEGTFQMLRHSYATALIQAGESAKTVQTLVGHHSASFTMDQYADAWPEQLERAGDTAARVLFAASGSKTVATAEALQKNQSQVIEIARTGR